MSTSDATQIVHEYKQSLLYSCRASVRVKWILPSSTADAQVHMPSYQDRNEVTKLVLRFVRARSLSPVIDTLIRFSACAPHVCMDLIDLRYSEVDNPDLDCSGKEKWSMMQKASASFAQLIAYSSNRCHADGFSRVLIPYAVDKHWNMIVVDVGEKAALLFEPNGVRYAAQNPHPTQVLERTIHAASKWTPLLETVRVCGGEGVQTALGLETQTVHHGREGSHVITKRLGLPICGAVIFWVMSEWMGKGANMRFDDFVDLLLNDIDREKALHVQKVTFFLQSLNAKMHQTYASDIDSALRKDFQHIPVPVGTLNIRVRVGQRNAHLDKKYAVTAA